MAITIRLRYLVLLLVAVVTVQIATVPVAVTLAQRGEQPAQVASAPVGSAFTYQGRLDADGLPAEGIYDLRFSLYDALSGGALIAGPLSRNDVQVSNGQFTVALDFGAGALNGQARFLAAEAKADAAQDYALLDPRQELAPAPYALYATNGAFWKLGGNAGTNPSTDFIGTTDNQPLAFQVGNQTALRIIPSGDILGGTPSIVGGSSANSVSALVSGAFIGGGGEPENGNTVGRDYGVVAGGVENTVSATLGTVGGGSNNSVSDSYGTVSGGLRYTAGELGTVPGGQQNIANGLFSFAAGNRARALGAGTFVWADGRNFDYPTSGALVNHFLVRATGGVAFTTKINSETGAEEAGCQILNTTNVWSCFSDRDQKTNFRDVDGLDVLAKLESVPIQYWTVKDIEDAPPHMGPMAQDFYAVFGLGDSDKTIATIDLDGVSLAAIKGLHEIAKEQEARLAAIEASSGIQRADSVSPLTARDSGNGMLFLSAAIVLLALAVAGHCLGWVRHAVARR